MSVIEEVDSLMPRLMALMPDVVIVSGDHSTPALLKGHSWPPVPVLRSVGRLSVSPFSNRAAAEPSCSRAWRAEHPRHPQGFEGVGVARDVSVSAGSALDQAHLLALSRIRDATTDPARRRELERVVLDAAVGNAEQTMRNVAAERRLRELEGSFAGGTRLAAREGGLRLEDAQRGLSLSLEEEGKDTYAVVGTPGQKLRLVRDASGVVTAIEVSSPGGGSRRRSDRVAEN